MTKMKKYKEFINEELISKEDQFIDASKNNDVNAIKKLLPLVDVNIKNNFSNTALIYASSNGYKEVVEILLKHPRIDVNIKNNNGYTALIEASYYGNKEVVELLLKHPSINVNIKNNVGFTALIWSSNISTTSLFPLIEDHIKAVKPTALIYASYYGYKEIVEMLLKHPNIDVNIQNNNGYTALIYVSSHGNKETVELLIPFLEEDSFVDSFYQILKDKDFNKIYIKVKEYLGRLKPIYATDVRELIQEIWDLNYYKDPKLLINIAII